MTKDKAYWEAKHPIVDQLYDGRPLPGTTRFSDWDVRHFVWADDARLRAIIAASDIVAVGDIDETVHHAQQWVCNRLKYVGDERFRVPEYFMFPGETLDLKTGDCEDGALLIASLALNAIPAEDSWRVRVAAGFVLAGKGASEGGHAYCVYCRQADNEWVAMDWCYDADPKVPTARKPIIKNVPQYRAVWFSFNHEHSWSHMDFRASGRVRGLLAGCAMAAAEAATES